MSTMTVEVNEAQTQLSKLLALALQGNKIVITENQRPMVQLVPIRRQPQRRIAGLHRGAMRMREDFNEPLPDAFWLGDV
ncbi:MAG: toxin-antitoxin (TA) system antitoxin [Chloroflexi bacterium]|nr:MAG: toxin-antitoxin (TA) system antitoxin [Chloroflexota bacterium]